MRASTSCPPSPPPSTPPRRRPSPAAGPEAAPRSPRQRLRPSLAPARRQRQRQHCRRPRRAHPASARGAAARPPSLQVRRGGAACCKLNCKILQFGGATGAALGGVMSFRCLNSQHLHSSASLFSLGRGCGDDGAVSRQACAQLRQAVNGVARAELYAAAGGELCSRREHIEAYRCWVGCARQCQAVAAGAAR